jgi:hypothetical protein
MRWECEYASPTVDPGDAAWHAAIIVPACSGVGDTEYERPRPALPFRPMTPPFRGGAKVDGEARLARRASASRREGDRRLNCAQLRPLRPLVDRTERAEAPHVGIGEERASRATSEINGSFDI